LFLIPGDSPMGYRLPLGSLPYLSPADEPRLVPADPYEDRGALADPAAMLRAFAGDGFAAPPIVVGSAGASPAKVPSVAKETPVRTALAVETRSDGHLCVFMPPVERVEDYLELLAAVEVTASDLGLRIQLEGYLPPPDPRLNLIKVTPDPGVIEVNIHPSSSWSEAVDVTSTLY
jgi:uncharacterized protein (DUF2126 family)